ncbi:hypothetical protein BKA01_000757 [Pseudonocardia eucalypti]|uniref:hypothetical protein n=1 Tax=Pseudonocardia eucalypti TaxID=648755 RepID=UPI001609D25F|nr:hypothetical protein [Pseudonocardia eucalypti]
MERWLAAVVFGARGDYAAAATLLATLLRAADTPAAVRAHAAVTRAAHLRQLGGHRAARRFDGMGLALAGQAPVSDLYGYSHTNHSQAPAADAAGAKIDALIGLAADAIGLADPDLAERLLDLARDPAGGHPSWRPKVRWRWVRAELSLTRGRPAEALEYAEEAVAGSRAARATRHEIKSELLLAVARAGAGHPTAELADELTGLAERAHTARLDTLQWPIQLMLADVNRSTRLGRSGDHRRRATEILARIRVRTDPQGRVVMDRSPWVPKV